MKNKKNNLAINGGEKSVKKTFSWPVFDENDVHAVTDICEKR